MLCVYKLLLCVHFVYLHGSLWLCVYAGEVYNFIPVDFSHMEYIPEFDTEVWYKLQKDFHLKAILTICKHLVFIANCIQILREEAF